MESEDGPESIDVKCDVRDPICDEFYHDTWIWSARRNMKMFEEVSIVPSRVKNRGGERVLHSQYTALKLKMQSHMTICAYVQ